MNVILTTPRLLQTTPSQSHFTPYLVTINGKLWCFADSDDDGMKLGIAIAKLELQRKMEEAL